MDINNLTLQWGRKEIVKNSTNPLVEVYPIAFTSYGVVAMTDTNNSSGESYHAPGIYNNSTLTGFTHYRYTGTAVWNGHEYIAIGY